MRIFAFADEASPLIDGQIAAMARNGLAGLEIRGVDGCNVSDITPQKAREVRSKLDDAGLITWSVGSPIGKIGIEEDFPAHLDKLRRTLEIAHILGAEQIRMVSFFIPKGDDPCVWRNKVLDQLRQMTELSADSGIVLCHENEKGIYGDIAARCAEIHQAIPALKAVFDPANFVQCGQDTLTAWELLRPYVKHLHIKDALADGNVVPAGCGIGHVPEILRAYRAAGGRDMTLEPHLAVFDGLQGLEREGDTSLVGQYVYPSNDAAFDAACTALKNLL